MHDSLSQKDSHFFLIIYHKMLVKQISLGMFFSSGGAAAHN
tara:strand:+ start:297 stop:419 length:123 start_codon:yes stop_codon:yes gene_type:complete